MIARLFFIFALLLPGSVKAANFSGEYFLKVCMIDRKGRELVKGGKIACQSYISGVIDYHNTMSALDLPMEFKFCIPEEETLNDIHSKILVYFRGREALHRKFVAAPGVAMALLNIYPCRK